MFVVEENPTFTHTVTAMVPTDGGYDKQSFKVTYNVLDAAEIDGFDLNTREGSDAFLRRVIHRLDDLVDVKGEPIPYSDAIRDRVIGLLWVRRAITRGYYAAVHKEAEGN